MRTNNSSTKSSYPKLAELLLNLCLPREINDYVLGDLIEEFTERVNSNAALARAWFWKQTLSAILQLSFKGNLKALAASINFIFFAVLSFVLLSLSGLSIQIQLQHLLFCLVALPFIVLPITNNSGVLGDTLHYTHSSAQPLSAYSLKQLSKFASFSCQYCVLVSPIFMLAPAVHTLVSGDLTTLFLPPHFLMGMALMTLVHASALHSIFSLLKLRGEQDAQLAVG